jgi:hypothetical protein
MDGWMDGSWYEYIFFINNKNYNACLVSTVDGVVWCVLSVVCIECCVVD